MEQSCTLEYGKYVIKDDKKAGYSIPYRDNVEEFLSVSNQVEYLQQQLDDDEKRLGSHLYNAYTAKESLIKRELIAAGVTVAASVVCGIASKNISLTMLTGALTASIVGGLVSLPFFYNYIPKKISAYRECVNYEKEALANLEKQLTNLSTDYEIPLEKNNTQTKPQSETIKIDESPVDYLKSAVNLRYYYGYNKKRVLGMYEKGILPEVLLSVGYSKEIIAEFLIYIEGVSREIKREKTNKKIETSNKIQNLKWRISRFLDE